MVAERDEADEQALDAYGRNLGIAFQLVDDAIDYASDGATMGKDTGDDFRDGKVTLPVILAYARGDAEQRRFWKDAIEGRRVSDADLAHAIGVARGLWCGRRHAGAGAALWPACGGGAGTFFRTAAPRRR